MNKRQSVALLSNNRKYLSIICNKGIDDNFQMIKNWLDDLDKNLDIILNLIKSSDDGINIAYGIIGTSLFCPEKDISLKSIQLLNKLHSNLCISDWDWLKKEGIDSIMFSLNQNDNNKLEIMNFLLDFIQQDTKQFFDILNNKIESNEKNKVLNFLLNILPIVKQLNDNFSSKIKEFLFDICLDEKNDLPLVVSILADAFYYFYPIDESLANKIIYFFKTLIKDNSMITFSTIVSVIFNLIEKFSQLKIKYAPQLYKDLVSIFLEVYDDIYKREFILENFEKFFNSQKQIPIDIFLEKYLSHLTLTQNYNLSDFEFLFRIVEHPRIESNDLTQIIQFLLSVCLNNVMYSRTANLILSLIFEKQLIQKICTPSDYKEITLKFIDFINNSLDLFMSSINNLEDDAILEMPYDIINEGFTNVNEEVYNKIVSCIKNYRKIKKKIVMDY